MTKSKLPELKANEVIEMYTIDGSEKPHYYLSYVNCLLTMPHNGVSLIGAIVKGRQFIHDGKIWGIRIIDGSDLLWGDVELDYKAKQQKTRAVTDKIYRVYSPDDDTNKYFRRAKAAAEYLKVNSSGITYYNVHNNYPRVIKKEGKTYLLDRIDGKEIKLKDIVL